jgi:hypothetical protein
MTNETAKQDRFDELFKCDGPKEYGAALNEIGRIANEQTRELREARDEAFRVYTKLSTTFNDSWRAEWRKARDEMIQGETDAES